MSQEKETQANKLVNLFMNNLLPSLINNPVGNLFQDNVKERLEKEVQNILDNKNKATFNEADAIYKMASVLNFKELLNFDEQRNLSRNMFDLDKHVTSNKLSDEELMNLTLITTAFYFSSINNFQNILSQGMNNARLERNDFIVLADKNRAPIAKDFTNVVYVKGQEKNRLFQVINAEKAKNLIFLSFINKPLVQPREDVCRKISDYVFSYNCAYFIKDTSYIYHKNILMSGLDKSKAIVSLHNEIKSLVDDKNKNEKSDKLVNFLNGFADKRSLDSYNDNEMTIKNEFLEFLGIKQKKSHFDWVFKKGKHFWHKSVVANAIIEDGALKDLVIKKKDLKVLDGFQSDVVLIKSYSAANSNDVRYDFIKGKSDVYNINPLALNDTLNSFFENVFVVKEDRAFFKDLVLSQNLNDANEILKSLVGGDKNIVFMVDLFVAMKEQDKLDKSGIAVTSTSIYNKLALNLLEKKTQSTENEMAYFLDKLNGEISPQREFEILFNVIQNSKNIEESPILIYMEDKYGSDEISKLLLDFHSAYREYIDNPKDGLCSFEINGEVVYEKNNTTAFVLSKQAVAYLTKRELDSVLKESKPEKDDDNVVSFGFKI